MARVCRMAVSKVTVRRRRRGSRRFDASHTDAPPEWFEAQGFDQSLDAEVGELWNREPQLVANAAWMAVLC